MALTITPGEAQAMQDAAAASDVWSMWFVSLSDPSHPSKAVAWAMTADLCGGARSPGLLIADTLDELRAMLPTELMREDRTVLMPAAVLETWD